MPFLLFIGRFLLKRYLRDYFSLLLVAGTVSGLDQLTKAIVRAQLPLQRIWVPWPWLEPYARIVNWKNTGAAFGMLPGLSDIFTILPFIVALAILYYYPQVPRGDWTLRLAMGLQMGGALGNWIDRLNIGYVTDFISIGNFPVFNVADASISIGVAILIISVWIRERYQDKHDEVAEGESSVERSSESIREEIVSE